MRLLYVPILGQLVELPAPDPVARRLFAYLLEWGAMVARSGGTRRNPGGIATAICRRWSTGVSLSRDIGQLTMWLKYSHSMDFLTIGQVAGLLMDGSAIVDLHGIDGLVDLGATPRQLEIARDAISLLVGHLGEHQACEECGLVRQGRWGELAPAHGPLNAILRDALDSLIEAGAYPPVRPKDLRDAIPMDRSLSYLFEDGDEVAA
jgi:hypothetical protein